MPRQIYQIAEDIVKDWKNPHYSAMPYLVVMRRIRTPEEQYMRETGRSIVEYFLENSKSYTGPSAKKLKQELKDLLQETDHGTQEE